MVGHYSLPLWLDFWLYPPHDYGTGLVSPTVTWAIQYQLIIKTIPDRQATDQSDGGSFLSDDSGLCEVDS